MDTQAMGNGLGLMNMFFHPVRAMESLFSLALAALLLSGALSSGGSLPLSASWPSLILYGLFALGLVYTLIYRSREKTVLERVFTDNARANTAANFFGKYIESGQAAKDARLYDQGSSIDEVFEQSFSSKAWLKFFMWGGRQDGFNYSFLAIIGGGFYLVTGLGALGGAASVGDIVRNVGAIMALASAIGALVSLCGQIYSNATFLKPMREFMTLPELLAKGSARVPRLDDSAYAFEFKDVSFRYPGAENYALQNLNLKINAGQRLAVARLNGAGKTTMIKLLCRFYDPTEGEILLGGVNIKEYDYDEYIKLFSVVFQDYMLFPLWLGNNVAAGAEYDAGRAEACLKDAGFTDRLGTMPEGLKTVLYKEFDENGTQISGGEAQKIALARALYKAAPVVVLDEPTAALDPIAEHEVYTTFDKTIGDKTAVFISHRLSSCRFCDDIAVFEGGRLIQRGDHETLLKDTGGRYCGLWNAQARHYHDE
jgi:ATP-binding cassette subfamily B protein